MHVNMQPILSHESLPQGLGDFINDDGSKIEGFWRENMLNGKITIKFSDGSVLKSVNYNDDKAMAEHVFADGRQ